VHELFEINVAVSVGEVAEGFTIEIEIDCEVDDR
jgi:hypothetical protein